MPSTFFTLIQQFFGSLRIQRNLSPHTLAAYRDTVRLLLRFLADQAKLAIDQLTLDLGWTGDDRAVTSHFAKYSHAPAHRVLFDPQVFHDTMREKVSAYLMKTLPLTAFRPAGYTL